MSPGKPIIGLVGGIGSGKTTVASMLRELGAAVISSDQLSHEVLDSPETTEVVRGWWGDEIIGPGGRPDRDAIRRLISEDPRARRRLEELVHPQEACRREQLTAEYQADPAVRAIVWDSPLLFEAGLAGQCTAVVFVEADEPARRERVRRERGWSREELERFEKSQKPLDFKRDRADHRVVNNSDRRALRQAVERVFSRILSGA